MDDTTDIREALAADLRRQGLMPAELEPAVDMTPEQAREAAWNAYGLTLPPDTNEY